MTKGSRALVPQRATTLPEITYPAPAKRRWWDTNPLKQLQNDAEDARAQAALLDAQAQQAESMRALVERRVDLAMAIAKLCWLPEILEHDIVMLRLAHRHAEAQALARVRAAEGAPDTTVQPEAGLTPAEVDDLVAQFPEISPETRQTLSTILAGRLKEKIR